jgi:hypothetical protein
VVELEQSLPMQSPPTLEVENEQSEPMQSPPTDDVEVEQSEPMQSDDEVVYMLLWADVVYDEPPVEQDPSAVTVM